MTASTERKPILNVVLYQPEIPGNTGAIGRTCVALGAKLWLVRPLGFQVDQKTLRRAGLDYWQFLDWEVANHWEDLMARLANSPGFSENRMWLFSRFATTSYTTRKFELGDTFVFGCETSGLPKSLSEKYAERLLRIPTTGDVRSLNLATSVGIAAYEAARQLGACDGLEIE